MKIVFFGTPEFAIPSLEALLRVSQKNTKEAQTQEEPGKNKEQSKKIELSAVVTRPDAIRKRGNEKSASPVKELALKHNLPLVEASKITPGVLEKIKAIQPDLLVVVAFGALLPKELLDIPKLGSINVHASLLPRWRGAAPIERAILAGDEVTGVSIMKVEEGLDSGDYCLQEKVEIAEKTSSELTEELAQVGAKLLIEAVKEIEEGKASWTAQDENKVTLAPKIDKEEMLLSPSKTVKENLRIIQASSRKAPARLQLSTGKNVRIVSAKAVDDKAQVVVEPFDVNVIDGELFFGANEGAFQALSVIPEGKREMSGADFARGLSQIEGLRWG